MFDHGSNINIFGAFLVRLFAYNIIQSLMTVKSKIPKSEYLYIYSFFIKNFPQTFTGLTSEVILF